MYFLSICDKSLQLYQLLLMMLLQSKTLQISPHFYLLKVVHKNGEITGRQFSKPSFNTKSFSLKIMPKKFRTFCLFSKHLCLRLNSCITDSNVMKVVKLLNVLNTNSLFIDCYTFHCVRKRKIHFNKKTAYLLENGCQCS